MTLRSTSSFFGGERSSAGNAHDALIQEPTARQALVSMVRLNEIVLFDPDKCFTD
jgi:hypothetical protein